LSPEYVQSFVSSLPKRYRENVESAAINTHARVVSERGDEPAHLGTFASSRPDSLAVCIVASDRPGLLANISAALVLCGIDVVDAELYTRKTPKGEREAVDLFWIRRGPDQDARGPVNEQDVSELKTTLIGLLTGKLSREEAKQRAAEVARDKRRDTIVRFIEGEDGSFSTLEVETADRPGVLLALSQALFDQRLQIVSSEVRSKDGAAFDRFTVTERDGASVSSERRLEIQVAVLSALEPSIR
jgi:[protein-PII] uridylyltransferase